jgi:hypothetical protein
MQKGWEQDQIHMLWETCRFTALLEWVFSHRFYTNLAISLYKYNVIPFRLCSKQIVVSTYFFSETYM